MKTLTTQILQFLAAWNGGVIAGGGSGCNSESSQADAGLPALNIQSATFGIDIECLMTSNPELMTCTALPPSGQRVCACLATPPNDGTTPPNDGTVGGDPHVHSLRGAHYTLLQEGVFCRLEFLQGCAGVRCSSSCSSWVAAPGGLCGQALRYPRLLIPATI